MAHWKLIDRDGKVAVTLGWQKDWNRPVEYQVFKVCDTPVYPWRFLLGNEVRFDGNHGRVFDNNGRPTLLDTSTWDTVTEERPIKKPRRRKDQPDWRWQAGRWVNHRKDLE